MSQNEGKTVTILTTERRILEGRISYLSTKCRQSIMQGWIRGNRSEIWKEAAFSIWFNRPQEHPDHPDVIHAIQWMKKQGLVEEIKKLEDELAAL